jgi:CubicO group peptidase (beta-lactamase class C family)
MKIAHIPGLAAVAIRRAKVVFEAGYGSAVLPDGPPVTPDTVFNIASISKTITALALLQLRDKGEFALDDDVAFRLPYVRNPRFPNRPISYRMLLAHTSSIQDGSRLFDGYTVVGADSTIPLGDFVHGYLEPGGVYYQPSNWSHHRPGRRFHYSDAGIAVAGAVVEEIAKTDLQSYSKDNIFGPLGMSESSWFLAGLDQSHIAMPYLYDSGQQVATGFYQYPVYPCGQLRTSARQLARFLMMVAKQGRLNGWTVLSPSTVAEMLEPQPNSLQGLSWQYFALAGRSLVGHSGVDRGVSTDMWFDPATGAGFVVLTNSNVYWDHWNEFVSGNYGPEIRALLQIERRLLKMALGQ